MPDPISTLPDPLFTSDPKRMGGTPCFTGTRIPVKILFDFLADGAPLDEFLTSYPDVTRAHAVAVLELARNSTFSETSKVAAE